MPIVVLALVLGAFAYALVAFPAFRAWGLALAALASLALGLYLWRAEPESEAAARRIAPSELSIDQVALERVGPGTRLSGRVLNNSPAFRLREMTLILRLRDCPEAEAAPAACPVIGEAGAVARPDAPPGQIRAFSAMFTFANVPPVAGALRWDWEIAATRATE